MGDGKRSASESSEDRGVRRVVRAVKLWTGEWFHSDRGTVEVCPLVPCKVRVAMGVLVGHLHIPSFGFSQIEID